MGDGVVINPPTGVTEGVYSPVSGTVSMLFDTKHAIGLLADQVQPTAE